MRSCKQLHCDRRRGRATGNVAFQRDEDGHGIDAEISDHVSMFVVEAPSFPM